MDIKDLLGVSEPLCKLIDTVQNGCSWVFKPNQIKRIAAASSDVASLEANADFKKNLKEALAEDTINMVRTAREQRQLNNIVNIYANTARELQIIENIDKTPVDPDWSARFFDYAKDISNEEAQVVWAKILAGEIVKPGSFFKRTLSILRDIESFEAKWFAEICQFVLADCIISLNGIEKEGYPLNQLQSLMDCGLINSTACQFTLNEGETELQGKTHSIRLLTSQMETPPRVSLFSIYTLTDAGIQLYRITPAKSHQTYMTNLKEQIERQYNIKAELIQIGE
ncbi:uncharacterized protein DUF2806 [Bacteroides heparinolyticus]|uniref:Uncharacterized protein DUF2806 n=1 Tax=Prevotella heparinolytica TaxID=28113 RepID=A0A4R2LHR5_9BACE|nr:DUF2806 domain-containing protein [Bacteroides heparinolyticus]TCO87445.1 uncharacterized protein DUF2806 [Bacteroides heparinolyticus]